MERFSVQRVGIVGLGLLGGSIARAARQRLPGVELIGFDANEDVRRRAVAGSVIDDAPDSLDGLSRAEFVVVCVPVSAVAAIVERLARGNPRATVTDVASSKQSVIRMLAGRLPPGFAFVPAHPMAGGEKGGLDAGRADLFEGKSCLITPTNATPADATARVETFWRSLGATPQRSDPATHDRMVALTSHLPHLLAFALVENLAFDRPESRDVAPFIGRSLDEQIRLASSEPAVWASIFETNASELLAQLERFQRRLADWRDLIAHAPASLSERLAQTTRTARAFAFAKHRSEEVECASTR